MTEAVLDEMGARFRVAAARRILGREGCESGAAGHVSERVIGEDAFWVSAHGYFDEARPEWVTKLDFDLHVLEGTPDVSRGTAFHATIYASRPDVNAIVHIHSQHLSVFVTTGRTVGMYNELSSLFYEEQALYEDDGILPRVDPVRIAQQLADKRVLLMKNHGAVIASVSLASATVEAIALERAARLDLEARAIGGSELPLGCVIPAKEAYRSIFVPNTWQANLRRLHRSDPDLFDTPH
jgi:L-fuculose-phosphate aldolase